MAPTPYTDASVNTVNGFVKSGCFKMGCLHIRSHSVSNACCYLSFQCQGVLLCVRSDNGFTIFE
jgi:hypothetical protein